MIWIKGSLTILRFYSNTTELECLEVVPVEVSFHPQTSFYKLLTFARIPICYWDNYLGGYDTVLISLCFIINYYLLCMSELFIYLDIGTFYREGKLTVLPFFAEGYFVFNGIFAVMLEGHLILLHMIIYIACPKWFYLPEYIIIYSLSFGFLNAIFLPCLYFFRVYKHGGALYRL